jgi:hypothetical protein
VTSAHLLQLRSELVGNVNASSRGECMSVDLDCLIGCFQMRAAKR